MQQSRSRVPFMTGDQIDFVTFDFALYANGGFVLDDPFAQLCRHLLDIVFIQIQLSSDLSI